MKTTNPPGTRKATVRYYTGKPEPTFEALVPASVVVGDVTRSIYPEGHKRCGLTGPTVRVLGLIDEEARAEARLAALEQRVLVLIEEKDRAEARLPALERIAKAARNYRFETNNDLGNEPDGGELRDALLAETEIEYEASPTTDGHETITLKGFLMVVGTEGFLEPAYRDHARRLLAALDSEGGEG